MLFGYADPNSQRRQVHGLQEAWVGHQRVQHVRLIRDRERELAYVLKFGVEQQAFQDCAFLALAWRLRYSSQHCSKLSILQNNFYIQCIV